jgi:hypothetical protein
MKSRGAGLLDVMAAMALAGLFLGASGRALRASARTLGRAHDRWTAQAAARNALEVELSAPCTDLSTCPPDYLCRISRLPGPAPGVLRIDSVAGPAERPSGSQVRFSVLVQRDSPCGG